ncbi:hypothetical protein WDW89_08260 [Deltaproteobacteria bacterium TL4]
MTLFILYLPVLAIAEPVLKFRGGQISPGTFQLLYQSDFASQKDPNLVVELLEKRETKGALATKRGLNEDRNYALFFILKKRSRIARQAQLTWRNLHPSHNEKNFEYVRIWRYLEFDIDLNRLTQQLSAYLDKTGIHTRLTIDPEKLNIGSWSEGTITLAMLQKEMLPEKWERMLSYHSIPQRQSLQESLELWTNEILSQKAVEHFKADEQELARQDHNSVADSYLTMKYAQGWKGIYPVKPIEIPFQPTELLEHFLKMKNTIQKIEWVEYRYTIVKDAAAAKSFRDALKKNNDFMDLARQYAVSPHYVETAKKQRVPRIHPKYGPEQDHLRPFIERQVLAFAKTENLDIQQMPSEEGIKLIQILNIQKENKEVQFADYRTLVRMDLQKKILTRQLPIELQDVQNELHFQVNLSYDASQFHWK